MAKKTAAQNNRRAVIDDIRKKQKGADKRRGFMIVGVCILVALLIVGAAAYRPIKNWWDLRGFNDLGLAKIGAPASSCDEVTTKPAEGSSEHVPQPQQVTYTTAPAAFGQHWNEAGVAPAPFNRKFYTEKDRPELEALVHNLEHGYTLLWYDDTAAKSEKQLAVIKAISKKFEGQKLSDKFIALPWTSKDEAGKPFPKGTHIALTHWEATNVKKQQGVWQYCGKVSGQAVKSFMKQYPYTDSPEPQGA